MPNRKQADAAKRVVVAPAATPLGRAFATGSGASGSAGSSGGTGATTEPQAKTGHIDQKKVLLERIAKARSEALAAEKPDSKPLDIDEDLD